MVIFVHTSEVGSKEYRINQKLPVIYIRKRFMEDIMNRHKSVKSLCYVKQIVELQKR